MTRSRSLALGVCFALLAVPLFAQSADSPVNHQNVSNILGAGARALGMGGAFTAIADDATASTWNPAGLRILSKPEASIVYDTTKARQEWQYDNFSYPADPADRSYSRFQSVSDVAQSRNSGVNFASGTLPFEMGSRRIVGQASFRRLISFPYTNNPYTYLITTYDRPYGKETSRDVFANIAYDADAGGIDDYTVSAATKAVGDLDVGLSINYMNADIDSRGYLTDTTNGTYRDETQLHYSFKGFHYDLGLLYRWHEMVSVGAVYHTGLSSDFDYARRETLFYHPLGTSPELVTEGKSHIKLPSSYAVGVAVRPVGPLTIAVDYSGTAWSKATISDYNYAFIDFNDDFSGFTTRNVPLRNTGFPYIGGTQQDTSTARIGAEYIVVLRHSVTLPLRAGYFTEEQITNINGAGQPTYKGFTAGTGIGIGRVQLDVAWVRTTGVDQGTIGIRSSKRGSSNTVRNAVQFHSDRVLASMIYRFH